jgi:hypothetical protein
MQREVPVPVFLISYDLPNEDSAHDYEPLWEELRNLGGVRTLLSEWYVNVNNTQEEVYDHFLTFMDTDDRLLVIEVKQRPSFNKGLKGTKDFVDAHFSR